MTFRHTRQSLLAAVSAAAMSTGALGGGALAQQSETGASERRTVDVITVTAQRREQGIQDVPIAVTAYSQELIQNSGINDVKDLQAIVPGLNVTSTQNEFVTTFRLRGVGTVGDNPGLESSVGVVIDGVPRARNGVGFNDLGEIERIEVLRGPQGTLFGKNTSAGVINVITAEPSFEFGAELEGTYQFGEAEGYGIAGSVTGPIAEDLAAFRLYAVNRERDGYQDVETFSGPRTTTEDANQDFYSIRGQLLFTPSPNVEIKLQGDYTERDEDCCVGPSIQSGPTSLIINALAPGARPAPGNSDPFSRTVRANRGTQQFIEDTGFQGELTWETDAFTLTAIASTRDYQVDSGQDTDFTGLDIVYRNVADNSVDLETDTFEIRLNGVAGRVDWLVGAYLSNEELERRDAIKFGAGFETYLSLLGGGPTVARDLANGLGLTFIPGYTPLGPGEGFPVGGANQGDVYNQEAESIAIFTHNTVSITDQLDFTFGLRWTNEDKSATADFSEGVSPACDVWETVFGEDLNFFTPTAQAQLAGFSAGSGVPVPGLIEFGTFTCLPFTRDVYSTIGLDQERSEEELSGLASLSYRFNEDFLGYATYSRGYKAGGFNLDRFTAAGFEVVDFTAILAGSEEYPAQFEPEIVDSYELGFKTEWANDTLLANLYLFYMDFETYQLNTFNGIAFFVTSVPGAESIGAELEFLFYPEQIEGLTLQGGVTYAETEYADFNPLVAPPTNPGVFDDVNVLSGKQFSLSPKWYVNGAVTYERPISASYEAFVHVDGRWVSDYNTGSDLDAPKEQEAFAVFNARVGVGPQDDRWSLELWSRNLFDEDYIQVGFDGPFQPGSFNAFLGSPRQWGATVRTQW